ncbi:MAG: cysteine desulfurase family protein [Bacteroidetes bacterium]|nr:cysteine desulfurase family protein [Bacteroidota bacterium]
MNRPIYFDNNATTAVEQAVLDRMIPYFTMEYGNPSNTSHVFGWAADEAVQIAREQLASLLKADPRGIVFTSGATEAINHVIKGLGKGRTNGHIITVTTEHKAVLNACEELEAPGVETTYLPVDKDGLISVDQVREALRDDTFLVAVMWANNETGVIQPIEEIGQLVKDHPAYLFTDATQSIGKVPVSVENIDFLALSAHKFYGPKGVGAVYIRPGKPVIVLPQLLVGGGQEQGRRASTLNVPGIVGLGAAAQIAADCLDEGYRDMKAKRDHFESVLRTSFPEIAINGEGADRLPQTSNITFKGIRAADMMAEIGKIAVSTGSACTTGSGKPSHVLSAMSLSPEEASGTVRFSMGRHTSDAEVRDALDLLCTYATRKYPVSV